MFRFSSLNNHQWWHYGLLLVVALAFMALPQKLRVNSTPSVPYRLFYLGAVGGPVQRGDFVTFDLGGKDVVKEVGCVGGERLSYDEAGRMFFCNGEYLGVAKTHFLDGRQAAPFHFDGVIPVGKLFVFGRHRDSYDSRYWGLLDESAIQHKALPIF